MYQNVLTPVTTFSIFKSGHQIATQLGYKMVHFRTLKNKKKACKLSVYTLWYILVLLPGGEWGIRTPGTSRFNSFQDCRNRPLCQLSGAKVVKLRVLARVFWTLSKYFFKSISSSRLHPCRFRWIWKVYIFRCALFWWRFVWHRWNDASNFSGVLG